MSYKVHTPAFYAHNGCILNCRVNKETFVRQMDEFTIVIGVDQALLDLLSVSDR